MQRQFTPEKITDIKDNEIFVFGSNLNGNHAGGAAKLAADKFGAKDKQAEGLFGQSYAIPTLGKDMKKLPLEEISTSIDKLYEFAEENADLTFWVTKIGCGIAGFEEKEIADLFKSKETPFNVFLPQEFSLIKGVKGFHKDMTCGGIGGSVKKQYSENTVFEEDVNPKSCNVGMHFCENPLDVFKYYNANESVFAEVEGSEKLDTENQNSKVATSKLSVKAKIGLPGLIQLGLEYAFKKRDLVLNKANRLAFKNPEDSNTLAGRNSNTLAGQDYNTLAGQDYNTLAGRNSNTLAGRNSNTLAGQDSNVIACRFNNTIELSGTNNVVLAANGSKVKGKIGNAICLVEFDRFNNRIINVKSAIIDGKILKEDVFYKLVDGEFIEI